ncbi:hypothetical protein L226DRAFT_575518 [Lentinus tigrinus ALCF2SS1-7]|nr:hypothetical protein L226DRAFT_575518 [Lentinus tigrinus ALCF2SS1-7]
MHAPRRKSCQALLPDGETPCSATFRGWGKYCTPHLEECAQLSGQFKDAAARAERLRRTGELTEKQVRALTNAASVDRAIDRVRQYLEALNEENRTRAALLGRFPAEKDERHMQRLTVVEERKTACSALIEQLQQHREEVLTRSQQRRERYRDPSQSNPERQPLLGRPRRSRRVWIFLLVLVLVVIPTVFMIAVLLSISTGSQEFPPISI